MDKSDGRRVLQGTRYLKISLANAVFVQASRNTALRTEPPPDCKTLFCRNLAYGVDEAALAKFVKGAGVTPIEVRIPKDWHTARSKGYAYVEFVDQADAVTVVDTLEGALLLGRAVHMDFEDRAGPFPAVVASVFPSAACRVPPLLRCGLLTYGLRLASSARCRGRR